MSKILRPQVSVILNNKVISEEVNESTRFSELKKQILNKYIIKDTTINSNTKVNNNVIYTQYSFHYNNVKIPDFYNQTIVEFFKNQANNEVLVLILKKNSDSTNNNSNKKLYSASQNTNNNRIEGNYKVKNETNSKDVNGLNSISRNTASNINSSFDNNLIEIDKNLISKVSITNFPSRTEVFMLVDKYLEANGLSKQYFSENRENEIIIKFGNTNVAFDFIKHINNIKSKSNLYQKMKTSLYMDINEHPINNDNDSTDANINIGKQTYGVNNDYVTKNNNKILSEQVRTSRNGNQDNLNHNKKNIREKKIIFEHTTLPNKYRNNSYNINIIDNNSSNSNYLNNNNKNSKFFLSEENSEPPILNNKINKENCSGLKNHMLLPSFNKNNLRDYNKNKSFQNPHINHCHYTFERKPAFIRNHSPYKSEEDIYNEEYQKNKQKWLDHKGFFTSIHKQQPEKFIKNFVNISQYKGSYKNYNFRQFNKNKWIDNKGFDIY